MLYSSSSDHPQHIHIDWWLLITHQFMTASEIAFLFPILQFLLILLVLTKYNVLQGTVQPSSCACVVPLKHCLKLNACATSKLVLTTTSDIKQTNVMKVILRNINVFFRTLLTKLGWKDTTKETLKYVLRQNVFEYFSDFFDFFYLNLKWTCVHC